MGNRNQGSHREVQHAYPSCRVLQRQIARHHFRVLPVDFSHLAMLEKLPHHHRDPFDRLLLAQCLQEDATLITVDRKMRRYGVPIIE